MSISQVKFCVHRQEISDRLTSDNMRLTRVASRALFDVPTGYIIVALASPVARSRFEYVLN